MDNGFKIDKGINLKPQASAPSNPANGDIYYDSGLSKFRKYQNGAWSDLDTTGGATSITSKNANFTVQTTEDGYIYRVLTSVTAVTATLPALAGVADGFKVTIKDHDGSAATNNITVALNSSSDYLDAIQNVSDVIKTAYGATTYVKHSTGWTRLTYKESPLTFITATGGTITTDGDYKVHTFNSSGTFQITGGGGLVDSLLIAGGGSGGGTSGQQSGGGGGAGGMLYTTGQPMSAGSYSVVVGAGATAPSNGDSTNNGSNSTFNSLTAIGGGGGGGDNCAPNNGGSGGGKKTGTTATGTVGQGNNGGGGSFNLPFYPSSGGGGAGAAGQDTPSGSAAGNGGAGLANSITGASVTYAGGGGGGIGQGGSSFGTGGSGGGGNGGANVAGTAGTANTGGGGGGSGWNGPGLVVAGSNGGSGKVIIRYKFQ